MRLCELKDFPNNDTLTIPYVNAFCFDYDKLEIEGFWTTESLKYLQIQVKICVNGTIPGVVCKSNEEIDDFFKSTYGFNFYFIDKTFNMDDLKNPIRTIITNKYTILNKLMYKYVDYFIKKVVFIDDKDFLFETNIQQESHIYDHAEIETNIRGNDTDPTLSVANFFSDRNTQQMVRRYEKLSEVLAKLGGIGGTLVSFGVILLGVYHKYLFVLNLANNNYKFQKLEKKTNEPKSIDEKQQFTIDPLLHDKEKEDEQNELPFVKFNIVEDKSPPKCSIVINEKNNEASEENPINFISSRNHPSNIELQQKHFKLQPKTISLEEIKSELKSNIPAETEKDEIIVKLSNSSKLNKQTTLQKKNRIIKFFTLKSKTKNFQAPSLLEQFRELNHKEKKEYELKFSFFDYISYLFRKSFKAKLSNKEKLFEQAEKHIKKDMDLYKIMKKLKEIDRMKVVLLGEKKIKLFNLLGGEMIYADRNELKEEDKRKGFYKVAETLLKIKDEKQFLEVIEYYEFLKSKKNITEEEKRLLDLIEDKINIINNSKK